MALAVEESALAVGVLAVRHRIAAALLGPNATAVRVGRFRLRDEQQDALSLILQSLREYGGALLADPPGAGKTVTALAVTARFGSALVLAPAALRAHWESAAGRAGVRTDFVSLEALSRGTDAPTHPLIIVDEAHHLRSRGSLRYGRVATLCVGRPVLLLTATPVVNRRDERDALLALFLGARVAMLDAAERARMILRRTAERQVPPPQRASPLTVPQPPLDVAAALRSLPAPWPTADGAAAAGLIRTTLAMAWVSSLAALDASLRRRLQRGEAVADELAAGRWPSRQRLRQWIVGDDATQLALPLLTRREEAQPPAGAALAMRAHLAAVGRLREELRDCVQSDTTARASALRGLIAQYAPARILCFAQHAETVRVLYRALAPLGGIVAIVGNRVLAAQGRWSRDEVLAQFAADAATWSPADIRAVRCLLSTDVLAEGVELPKAAVLVHLDPAWTPARLEQREGRAARPGADGHTTVYRVALPPGAQPLLRLGRRLRRKQRARVGALTAANAQGALRLALQQWLCAAEAAESAAQVRIAALRTRRGAQPRCLALLRSANARGQPVEYRLVGGVRGGRGWRLSSSPAPLLRLIGDAAGSPADCPPALVREIRRALRRYVQRREVRDSAGLDLPPDALTRQMRRRLDEALARCSLAERAARAQRWSQALHAISGALSAGVARAAATAMADADATAALESLVQLAQRLCPARDAEAPAWRLSALLVLLPPDT